MTNKKTDKDKKEEGAASAKNLYEAGFSFILKDDYETALSCFEKAVRINPNDADAHFYIGHCYNNLNRHTEAIESFKQAIRLKPDYVIAYNNLGVAYVNLRRYPEAIEAFKQAIRLNSNYALAHYGLGFAYVNLHRYPEAIEPLKQAIRLKPDFAEAHFSLGIANFMLGNNDSVLEEYKILKDLGNPLANELLNFIYGENNIKQNKKHMETDKINEEWLMRRFLEIREQLIKDLEREPLDEEIAAYIGIPVNQVKAIKERFKGLIRFGDSFQNNRKEESKDKTLKEKVRDAISDFFQKAGDYGYEPKSFKEGLSFTLKNLIFIFIFLLPIIGVGYLLELPSKPKWCVVDEVKRFEKIGFFSFRNLSKWDPDDVLAFVKTLAKTDIYNRMDENIFVARLILEKCNIKY